MAPNTSVLPMIAVIINGTFSAQFMTTTVSRPEFLLSMPEGCEKLVLDSLVILAYPRHVSNRCKEVLFVWKKLICTGYQAARRPVNIQVSLHWVDICQRSCFNGGRLINNGSKEGFVNS